MSRTDRYRKRLQEAGDDVSALGACTAMLRGGVPGSGWRLVGGAARRRAATPPALCLPTHLCSPPPPLPALPDKDNPLPSFIDPITMSAVVRPAISPYGHVAGLATWKVGWVPRLPLACALPGQHACEPWLVVPRAHAAARPYTQPHCAPTCPAGDACGEAAVPLHQPGAVV